MGISARRGPRTARPRRGHDVWLWERGAGKPNQSGPWPLVVRCSRVPLPPDHWTRAGQPDNYNLIMNIMPAVLRGELGGKRSCDDAGSRSNVTRLEQFPSAGAVRALRGGRDAVIELVVDKMVSSTRWYNKMPARPRATGEPHLAAPIHALSRTHTCASTMFRITRDTREREAE